MITCLIVDDEPYSREELADLLSQTPDIEIIGQCGNAIDALSVINKEKPQLVFLDIQMPQISGIELIAMLDPETMPRIVFATAYDEYAIKAFEHHAFDYLLKPIDEERLAKTLQKVRRDLAPRVMAEIVPQTLTHLPCYLGNKLKVVPVSAVEYIFTDLSGVHVATSQDYVHTQLTLKVLEEKTPLVRSHKQYLISPEAISEIVLLESGAEAITHSGTKVPISRRYLKSLKQLFGYH
ncbi:MULTISPECIES: two-component system response regulator BtsR [Pseudovibrio]|uniref:two-component system response regulator BtsR n=1 Tax=Stappiaceae TaxID=2821832 RepID=UPI00236573FB|nr:MULTISPECIES: two-component system response regulator BtsR [Pseudovibrio]MDD7911439.1 two-component system response regulator BtsR [Pseudovibrio exalbescens]MDX5594204.1 two-component system response regulator BtsR [Pseudovibrio sp. SPO723]